MAKQLLEIDEVMEWLLVNHPDLHKTAELDRNWVWLCCGEQLRGDEPEKVAARKSLGEFGFRWARRGHDMPSGNIGIWAHACLAPKRFEHSKPQPKPANKPKAKAARQAAAVTGRVDPFSVQDEPATPEPVPEPLDPVLAAGLDYFNS